MPAAIRIIVTAFASQDVLPGCLAALAAQSFEDFEVVVVDNGGAQGGAHNVALPDRRFRHVISPVNDGFAGGFMRGAQGAGSEWLMSVNPDTCLDPGCLAQLVAASRAHGDPAMLSPVLYADSTRNRLDGLGDSLGIWGIPWRNAYRHPASAVPDRDASEVFGPTGAAALYRRDAFVAAGGFDPAFFCYLEDVDLALRLRGLGGRCLLVHGATGVHLGGHSTKRIPGFALRHSARNAVLMIRGSAPLGLHALMWPLYRLGQWQLQRRGRASSAPDARAAVAFREAGFAEAAAMGGTARAKRRARPAYPFGASLRVARRLGWSLRGVRTHAPLLWEWE